jgi:hypothetical protein
MIYAVFVCKYARICLLFMIHACKRTVVRLTGREVESKQGARERERERERE